MKILGIESSCDETAAAVVENGHTLLGNEVASSIDLHKAYGGVVPEIAARSHIEVINPLIDAALATANTDWSDVDGIAVTYGPGLGGSLLVGVLTARTYAITKKIPLYAVNHVQAHPFATFLTDTLLPNYRLSASPPSFPLLALIVSGGHSQLVLFTTPFQYRVLGKTRDDAVGEAFDKVAKILGLPYPGGPSVSQRALDGNPRTYQLPVAQLDSPYDFSFSGLKTAVLRTLQAEAGKSYDFPSTKLSELLNASQIANMAASFQYTAVKTLVQTTKKAVSTFGPASIVVAGGVAANQELRHQLNQAFALQPIYPDIKLCTDNAAMIATLGCLMRQHRKPPVDPYSLEALPNLSM